MDARAIHAYLWLSSYIILYLSWLFYTPWIASSLGYPGGECWFHSPKPTSVSALLARRCFPSSGLPFHLDGTIGIGTAEHFPVLTHSKGSVLPGLKMFKAHGFHVFQRIWGRITPHKVARSIWPMMPSIRHLLGCCPGCSGWPREDLGFPATTSLHPGAIFKYLTIFWKQATSNFNRRSSLSSFQVPFQGYTPFGCVWKWLVPHCTQWFCWSLSLWKMASYHWEYTQHFQTHPFDLYSVHNHDHRHPRGVLGVPSLRPSKDPAAFLRQKGHQKKSQTVTKKWDMMGLYSKIAKLLRFFWFWNHGIWRFQHFETISKRLPRARASDPPAGESIHQSQRLDPE